MNTMNSDIRAQVGYETTGRGHSPFVGLMSIKENDSEAESQQRFRAYTKPELPKAARPLRSARTQFASKQEALINQ